MGAGVETLLAAQRDGWAAIAAAAPDAAAHAEGEAYFARLCASFLERFLPAPSAAMGGLSYVRFRLAGANPDYEMAQALLAPGRRYRLAGRRNGADRIGIGLYSQTPGAGLQLDGYATLDQLEAGADGAFDVELGAGEGPLGGAPTTSLLIVRELYRRPEQARAELGLTALDPPPAQAAPDTETLFRMAAAQISGTLGQFLHWSEVFARTPNQVTPMPAELDEAVRGDPGTRYFSGYWTLAPDEHLEIEIPKVACGYWMIQANNHWLEPIRDAHRNDVTAVPDPDGVVRIRIAPGPGALPNWLNVQGRQNGTILYRTVDAATAPVPVARVRKTTPAL